MPEKAVSSVRRRPSKASIPLRADFTEIPSQPDDFFLQVFLIDHARRHTNRKRGGEFPRETLDETALLVGERASDLLALDDALKRLSAMDPRKAQVVELRYFGGLNIQETAEVIKVSEPTVQREWKMAKAWLYREIKGC